MPIRLCELEPATVPTMSLAAPPPLVFPATIVFVRVAGPLA